MPALKSKFEAASESRPSPSPAPQVQPEPVLEADRIAAQMSQAERDYVAQTEALRAESIALGERRRPACEAISRLRTSAEQVINARRHRQAALARAAAFNDIIASQVGGASTDLGIVARLAEGDPASATAERLAEHIQRWLAVKEPALATATTEARRLAEAAPDNAPLLADLAAVEASLL